MSKIRVGVAGHIGIVVGGGGMVTVTPANVAGGPAVWLDAGFTDYGNKTLMDAWADRSGNGNNATQSTESFKPFYRKNVINGRAVACFDGLSNFMQISTSSVSLGTQFIVCNTNPNINGHFSEFEGLGICGATANTFFLSNLNTPEFRPASQGVGSNVRINGSSSISFVDMNAFKIVTGWWDGTPPTPTNLVINRDRSNGSRVWTGCVAEIILYETILTTAQIEQVEEYLRNKYLPNLTLGFE